MKRLKGFWSTSRITNRSLLRERYHYLFADLRCRAGMDAIDLKFALRSDLPPDNMVSNINIVPFIGGRCVVVRLANGDWEIPGGTLEPGETYLEAVRRELMEEVGARLVTFKIFGAWYCHSSAVRPYRDYLPHPEFYRVVGYGDVELVDNPLNPTGGETTVAVECLPVDEAARRFLESGRPDLADLYRLAAELRSQGTASHSR